ncbi:MAG: hypothetical protein AB7K24_25355 [Gemmataceae bacterium]
MNGKMGISRRTSRPTPARAWPIAIVSIPRNGCSPSTSSSMPLLPLLRAMGATDQELRDAWGPEILAANMQADNPQVLKKLRAKFLSKKELAELGDDEPLSRAALIKAVERTELDPAMFLQVVVDPAQHTPLQRARIASDERKSAGRVKVHPKIASF